MKFDVFRFVIFFCLSALLSWVGYELGIENLQKLLLLVGLGAFMLVLSALISIKLPDYPKSQVNLRIMCYLIFCVLILMNFVFSFFRFSISAFIIPNGVLLLLTLLLSKTIIDSKQ